MARNEITYDMIKPLVISAEADGRKMHCEFALPGSDEIFEASVSIPRSRDVGSVVKSQVTRSIVNEVRRGLGRMLRGVFGSGMLGRTARTVVNTASRDQTRSAVNAPSAKEKEMATVNAFKRVAGNFAYNEATGGWTKPTDTSLAAVSTQVEVSPFEKQLSSHPVNTKFGKSVLARVLAHIAYADGNLADEEAEFFKDSIPAEFGDIQSLGQGEPISRIEAEEVDAGIRETVLMLAWTISAVDMDVDPQEEAMLNEYAEKFGISSDRHKELANIGRIHVLEGYMTPELSRDDLFEMASKLGLSNDDAERAKVRWMKRQ